MKNLLLSAALIAVSYTTLSQVGIGTITPRATLDVVGAPTDTAVADGFMPPRLTGDQLVAKAAAYDGIADAEKASTMVYVTAVPTTAGAGDFVNINAKGYYYLNDIGIWQKASTAAGSGLTLAPAGNIILGGALTQSANINGISDSNSVIFEAETPESAFITIRSNALGGSSGGLRFGNFRHGIQHGYPNLGSNNHLGVFTSLGNIFLSTRGENDNPADPPKQFVLTVNGDVGIGTDTPTSKLHVVGLPVFANNGAAKAGLLTVGAFYHKGNGMVRVVY